MPDFCYNTIIGSAEDIRAVLEIMKSEKSDFDFERLIPMPEILHRTVSPIQVVADEEWDSAEFEKNEIRTISKTKHEELVARHGSADWHSWSKKNWGTTKPAHDVVVEPEKITFVTAWEPATHVMSALAERLPSDAEIDFKWELDQGNGAEYQIADNMVHDVDFWTAPGFETPLDSVPDLRKCYLAGGRGNSFAEGLWYVEGGHEGDPGYKSAIEAIVFEEIETFDHEDGEIAEEFWEAYSPQDGLRTLDHIEDTVPDLTDEMRTLMQCARDTVPTQKVEVGPKA
jgi:hypothetical protein